MVRDHLNFLFPAFMKEGNKSLKLIFNKWTEASLQKSIGLNYKETKDEAQNKSMNVEIKELLPKLVNVCSTLKGTKMY